MQLTDRQEQILRTIVDLYVATARPVGSAAVLAGSRLRLSTATVRNEMAVLEDLGYIQHLHTSGGRIPTNTGYRYYLRRLIEPGRLSLAEARAIRHEFEDRRELQEWLKLAANVMASRSHNLGMITAPQPVEIKLRRLELVSLHEDVALLIVVLQDGNVLQEMVKLTETRSQEELSALADRLNRVVGGMTPRDVERKVSDLAALDEAVANAIPHILGRGQSRATEIYHAGLGAMIRQPEFLGPRPGEPMSMISERLGQMVDFLGQGLALQELAATLPPIGEVEVVIGPERSDPDLHDYSFVVGRYGHDTESSGYLGVIGPTRMEYPRAISLVRYMTNLMTDLVQSYS